MWLLNHSTARDFEIPMLKAVGIAEIFLPKSFPSDPVFRSASVDWSEDAHLTIPPEDLAVMNAADWYAGADEAAWRVANRHFDICFFIINSLEVLRSATRHFAGALCLRSYGMTKGHTCTNTLLSQEQGNAWRWINGAGKRFFFAKAYAHIDRLEAEVLKRRSVFLPLGMLAATVEGTWLGNDKRMLFVCPDIGCNPYYRAIYKNFVADFHGIPYAIAGAQPVAVDDPAVLGFLPRAQHEENMRQMRVMFYHSTDADHIHYHPFEAIRTGMPLLYMASGMLDRLGGNDLPGRCSSVEEARAKAQRILDGDSKLTNAIIQKQSILLEPMKAENSVDAWRAGLERIVHDLATSRNEQKRRATRRKRVAVVLPTGYRGGTLRGAKLLARALHHGSREAGQDAEVIFVHPDLPDVYAEADFDDIHPEVRRRPFRWKILSQAEARRAMRYAGHSKWEPLRKEYLAMDDGIRQLLDCDAWIVVSDRLSAPLLPVRPCIHMVYDYVQRYLPILPHGADQSYLEAARLADLVLVTTQATAQDALQYAGVAPAKVVKVPVLAPDFSRSRDREAPARTYFLWTTNAGLHKNHRNAVAALKIYYEQLDGQLDCHVTGQDTAHLLTNPAPHLQACAKIVQGSKCLRRRIRWRGELIDADYQAELAEAAFLWHAAEFDNGTLSVVESARLRVPALSSDYPAMREINTQFSLNLAWMDARNPREMAAQLKRMEQTIEIRREALPTVEQLAAQSADRLGRVYWEAVSKCL